LHSIKPFDAVVDGVSIWIAIGLLPCHPAAFINVFVPYYGRPGVSIAIPQNNLVFFRAIYYPDFAISPVALQAMSRQVLSFIMPEDR
jgi:hypothetical protein